MRERLVDSITDRIRNNEAQEIDKRALGAAEHTDNLEKSVADAGLIKQSADAFYQRITEQVYGWRSRGFIKRLFLGGNRPNDWYMEHFDADFTTPIELHLRHLMNGNPIFREIADLTHPFGLERQYREELTLQVGWQVAAVTKRTVQHPGNLVTMPDEYRYKPLPVRIWRFAQEEGTGVSGRELVYDISRIDGGVQSFTNGILDDRYVTISKQAGDHALSLINQATKYIN